ncbi:MAG: inositol monophosphatase [Magnetococcus sp. WYHC-3]
MRQSPVLNVMIRAARQAGALALQHFDRREELTVQTKNGPVDYVTNADVAVERELIHLLRKAFPDHGVLAEEGGRKEGKSGLHWVIDPIDGTTNFARGIPHFCISLALARGDELVAGLVFDPAKDELFTADKGGGAFLNERRIRVSEELHVKNSVVATGFPMHKEHLTGAYLEAFGSMYRTCGQLRRGGSAALDLAYVAAGRLDGYWEPALSRWDIAAGILLVREAGGFVCDFGGSGDYLDSGDVLAANPGIHPKLLKILNEVAWPGRRGTGPRGPA